MEQSLNIRDPKKMANADLIYRPLKLAFGELAFYASRRWPIRSFAVIRNDEDFSYASASVSLSRPFAVFFLLFLSKLKKPLHFVTLFRQNAVTRS